MQEIILTKKNIENLPEFIRASKDNEVKVFFPDYFYPEENEKYDVPKYDVNNIRIIERAKEIAAEKGITIISNHRSYDRIIPEGFERDNFSQASVLYENTSDSNPLVSVIIVTNNRREYLKRTINAIAYQNFDYDYEIIIADDASSDGTDDMIRALQVERKIKHIYWGRKKDFKYGTPTNRVGPMRNLGVKYSSGRILVFLDADIIANPDFLDQHVKSCDEGSVVIGPSIREREGLDKREDYFSICEDKIDTLPIRWTLLHSGNFSVHKKNFQDIGGFDKDFVFYGKEDEEIGYRLYKKGLTFKLNRDAYGTHLYHEPEYINETLKKIMHIYQVRIFYKKHLDSDIFHRFNHTASPHLIKLGNKCNNNCRFCERLEKKSFKEKGIEEIKDELKWAREYNFDVVIGGGEPTIRRDFFEILRSANELNLRVELISNGRIFSDIKNVRGIKQAGIEKVMVYFFAYEPKLFERTTGVPGSYKQTLKGIKNLLENNVTVSLNIVLTSENYKDLPKMIKLCHTLGVKTFHLTILTDEMSHKEITFIAETAKKLRRLNFNIKFRDKFINCINEEAKFRNEIDKVETCARCKLKHRCPFSVKKAFVRIDDVEEKASELVKLTDMLLNRNIPLSFQVVPKNVTMECVDWLNALKDKYPGLVEIGQHGWSHRNYDETREENYEFGPKRDYEQQLEDIRKGKERMRELFGDNFTLIFTPPYHGYDENTIRGLNILDFDVLSTGKTKPESFNGLVRSCKLDILEYKKGYAFEKNQQVINKEFRKLKKERNLGLVLHPQYIKPTSYDKIRYVLEEMKSTFTFESLGSPVKEMEEDTYKYLFPGTVIHNPMKRYIKYYKQCRNMEALKPSLIKNLNLPAIDVEITHYCNLSCQMCDTWVTANLNENNSYLREGAIKINRSNLERALNNIRDSVCVKEFDEWRKKNHGLGETLTYEKMKGLIDSLMNLGLKTIRFSGGEPLLHKDFERIVDYMRLKDIKGVIITNGTLMDERLASKLMKDEWRVTISLDAPDEETHDHIRGRRGVFKKCINTIRLLEKYKKKYGAGNIRINTVITDRNSNKINEMIRFAKKIGVPCSIDLASGGALRMGSKGIYDNTEGMFDEKQKSIIIEELKRIKQRFPDYKRYVPWTDDYLKEQIPSQDLQDMKPHRHLLQRDIFCFHSINACTIKPNGNVYPCCHLTGTDSLMGNINHSYFEDIWTNKRYNKLRESIMPISKNAPYECSECGLLKHFEKITIKIKEFLAKNET